MTFISYAQNYEDVMLWRALKHIEHGFYVDVGANDPVDDSVTCVFYQRGWHGINIEPMEVYYERLEKERPLDVNLRIAAGDKAGQLTFYEVLESGLSTLDTTVAEEQKNAGMRVVEHPIEVLPLNKVLAEHAPAAIHFLKIDVEGAEKVVLEGLDLNQWRPWIMVVEATRPNSSELNFSTWESLLLENRYHFVYFDGLNRFYIADEQSALDQSFQVPPNFFDNFITGHEQKRIQIIDKLFADLKTWEAHGNMLSAELNASNERTYQVMSELAAVKIDLATTKAELDKVYHSRSYRITAPLRAVAGKARVVRGEYKVRLEPAVHKGVVQMRRLTLFEFVKNGVKKNLPGVWLFFRKALLPSFDVSLPSSTALEPLIGFSSQSEEFLEDKKHFLNLFETEAAVQQKKPDEAKK